MIRLLLLFTVLPALELLLLLQVGAWLGPLQTFALIVLTGVVGAWLARREGAAVLQQLAADVQRGVPPAGRLVEGALVFAGGLLLVTPGIVTDITGFLFVIPFTRRLFAPALVRALLARVTVHEVYAQAERSGGPVPDPSTVHPISGRPPRPRDGSGGTPFDHPVAE